MKFRYNVLLILQFDGFNYYGWQKQPDVPTVQGTLEKALKNIFNKEIKTKGCSRTDAKAHAFRYYVNFKIRTSFPILKIKQVLNQKLPPDIRVLDFKLMTKRFHARFDAKWRLYRYFIALKESPFFARYSWYIGEKLNVEKMAEAAKIFEGTHDFASFTTYGKDKPKDTRRTVYRSHLKQYKDFLVYTIKANSFLPYMIRKIVSCLVTIGRGKEEIEFIKEMLEAPQKIKISPAPAQGLFLWRVGYYF